MKHRIFIKYKNKLTKSITEKVNTQKIFLNINYKGIVLV
jgi:hypothetical protein